MSHISKDLVQLLYSLGYILMNNSLINIKWHVNFQVTNIWVVLICFEIFYWRNCFPNRLKRSIGWSPLLVFPLLWHGSAIERLSIWSIICDPVNTDSRSSYEVIRRNKKQKYSENQLKLLLNIRKIFLLWVTCQVQLERIKPIFTPNQIILEC